MRYVALLLLFLATACRDNRPPAPTAEESDQLNDVEAMLNQQGTEESRK